MKEDSITYSARSVNKVLYNKQKWRPNNEIVAAMYAMYSLGHSLEYIGNVYHKSRQAIYCLFKSRGYKLRSKQKLGLQFYKGVSFTLNEAGFLVGTIGKRRVLMHRYVWEVNKGEIPKNHLILHKDGNKENNKLSNLKILDKHKFNTRDKNRVKKVTNNKKLKK